MLVMTYSQARQNFSSFLDKAKIDGEAIIKRSDGSSFKVVPVENKKDKEYSAFKDVKPVGILKEIPFQDILQMMKEDEDERTDRILAAASGKTIDDFFDKLKKL